MKIKKSNLVLIFTLTAAGFSPNAANAAIVISEVHPTGGGNASYQFDWFELTNTDPLAALNITGWQMDDNSNGTGKVAIRGVTSIGPGQTIVFFEGTALGTTDSTRATAFNTAWGSAFIFGINIGAYGGTGVSLGSVNDAVNIYDSLGVLQANVVFSGATTAVTYDNAAGLNNTTISQLSVAGINGAYSSGGEIGSPGVIPETSSLALVAFGAAVATFRRARRD